MRIHNLIGTMPSALASIEENSFDGVFCDPPYELGFMGKSWDSTGVAFQPETWAEVLRVCKPGAHLLAFGGSRTFHRLVCAVEDAGWEVRDVLMWLYGSGFPKSLDVSKAIDKAAGAEREVISEVPAFGIGGSGAFRGHAKGATRKIDAGSATDAARMWSGYGTALKPAYEPCLLARKPLDGTVAANVQKWGCGALWIDGGRIGQDVVGWGGGEAGGNTWNGSNCGLRKEGPARPVVGRWPANVLHDGLPEEWARYFYCAKASTRERDAGCEAFEKRDANKWNSGGIGEARRQVGQGQARNVHPTVKPLDLCRYLATLILPPTGRQQGPRRLLVPFSGSGSEMIGAIVAGWENVVGVEASNEYATIARARAMCAMNANAHRTLSLWGDA